MHSAIVIGAGLAGATRAEGNHARSLARHPDTHLLGIFDIDPNAARHAAQTHGTTAVASLDEALGLAPEIVVLAIHPEHRRDAWKQIWNCSSVRHVICEKPLALSTNEAKWICDGFSQAGIPVTVNFQRRLNPTFLSLKDDIDSGRRGTLQNVLIHYTRGLRANACHWLDLMVMLFGPPQWINAEYSPISSPYEDDPNATIVLGYPTFHAELVPLMSFHEAFYTGDVDITFKHERIYIPSTTNYRAKHAKRWVANSQILEDADVDFPFVNPEDDFYPVVDMVAGLLSGQTADVPDKDRELWPARLIDLAEKSCREHRRIDVTAA